MLGGMARPIPEPPPAGELRKVKIAYRCEICGAEVRMTVAPQSQPVVLRGATIHEPDTEPAPADGEILIDRINVDFIQVL
jgi:hypothetical protein